ncbi:TetR/AcrR family transcriptional regulator [Myxococcota bacterium]|nr:TetR/AcrR family transcriptional regulator [Myxococcota bacterium]
MNEIKKPDRRTIRSRSRLQEALLVLLDEKEYDQISVADVADRANVSRPTFYAHYKTKDDLLLSYFDRIFASNAKDLEDAITNAEQIEQIDITALGHLMTNVFAQWQKHRALIQTLLRSRGEGLILQRFQENTLRTFAWIFEQTHLPPRDPHILRLLADYFSGVALSLVKHWSEGGFVYSAESMGRIYSLLVRPAIEQLLGQGDLDKLLFGSLQTSVD